MAGLVPAIHDVRIARVRARMPGPSPGMTGRKAEPTRCRAERPPQPHRLGQGDAEDHQGHADGRGREAAPRADGGRGRAALRRAHDGRCWRTSPAASRSGPRRPRLLAGTGRTQSHLLVVCTAERGLCGAFNSSIARLARDHASPPHGRGQDGQDPLRRQEGLRHPAPAVRAPDHRARRPRGR